VDRVRNQKVPQPGPTLDTLGECFDKILDKADLPADEAFTSENWIVRIYEVSSYFPHNTDMHSDIRAQVKRPDVLGRPLPSANAFVCHIVR